MQWAKPRPPGEKSGENRHLFFVKGPAGSRAVGLSAPRRGRARTTTPHTARPPRMSATRPHLGGGGQLLEGVPGLGPRSLNEYNLGHCLCHPPTRNHFEFQFSEILYRMLKVFFVATIGIIGCQKAETRPSAQHSMKHCDENRTTILYV